VVADEAAMRRGAEQHTVIDAATVNAGTQEA
jgi:hypothetical protein